MKNVVKKSDRRQILEDNNALPEHDPRRMDFHVLREIGVVTQVSMSLFYRGEEYIATEYVDDEAFTPEEIMGHFVKPFKESIEKRDKKLNDN